MVVVEWFKRLPNKDVVVAPLRLLTRGRHGTEVAFAAPGLNPGSADIFLPRLIFSMLLSSSTV